MSRPSTDRAAIRAILTHLTGKGYRLTGCEERERNTWALTPDSVAEFLAKYLDAGSVYLKMPTGDRARLFFVMGNDPEEVLCDYSAPTTELLDVLAADKKSLTDTWWSWS